MMRILTLILLSIAAPSLAAGTMELSYGGRLTASNGMPISGPVTLEVQFYRSPSGSDIVPVAIPAFSNTKLADGVFQIAIGLSSADFHIIFDGQSDVWLQLRDATNNVTYPRQKFSPVPYALKVPIDGKFFAYDVDGKLTLNAVGAGTDKFLKIDTNGDLIWSTIPSGGGGGGDMFKSDNLSGLSSYATARSNLGLGSLATESTVTSATISDGTITNADISPSAAISVSKISGLGSAAAMNVGTTAGTVAAGDHSHDFSSMSGNVSTTGSVNASTVQSNSVVINSDNTRTVTVLVPNGISAGYTLTLPSDDGSAGQFLSTDGNGNLSWSTAAGGGGGDMFKADNLSGLGNTATARTNLGLGSLATMSAVGSSEITNGSIADADVAAGAGIATSKLSGAVTNITGHGLGSLATINAVGSAEITDGSVSSTDIADGAITDADINATAGISYLKISGLGSAASKNVGTGASDVAAGNHTHAIGSTEITDGSITNADVNASAAIATSKLSGAVTSIAGHGLGGAATLNVGTAAGTVAAGNHTHVIGSAEITDSSIVDADVSASAAISGSKISPNFDAQAVTTTGNVTGAIVQGNTSLRMKSDNANTVELKAPTGLSGNVALTLPANAGSSGQMLRTDGSGTLSWGSAGGTVTTAARSANFSITASDAGTTFLLSNAITVSLPTAASVGNGFVVNLKRTGGNAHACIQPSGAETLDGVNAPQCIHKPFGYVSLLSTGTAWVSLEKDGLASKGYRYYRFYIAEHRTNVTNNGHCVADLTLWIDGKKAVNGMTSNTTGTIGPYSPVVSAQSQMSASYAAWKAFDTSYLSEWEGVWADVNYPGYPTFLKIDFGAGFAPYIHGYDVVAQTAESSNSCGGIPIDFQLEGSDDNSTWTLIPGSRMATDTEGPHAVVLFDW